MFSSFTTIHKNNLVVVKIESIQKKKKLGQKRKKLLAVVSKWWEVKIVEHELVLPTEMTLVKFMGTNLFYKVSRMLNLKELTTNI